MSAAGLELAKDEEVLLEEAPAVLTNRRLMVDRARDGEEPEWEEFTLKDISLIKKKNGGKERRLELGLKMGAAGIVFILLETIVPGLPHLVDTALFLLGAAGFLAGTYTLVSTFLGVKPHTAVSIVILGERDKVFVLPGHDNPAADTITQRFAQARRRL